MRLAALFLAASGCLCLQAQPVQIRTEELPWAVVGTDYRFPIETTVDSRCPEGDAVITLAGGALPRGLEIRGWNLVGIPRDLGAFRLAFRAATGCSSVTKVLDLVVTGKPILRAAPESVHFEYHVGELAPEPQTVLISGTWPNLAYSVSAASAPWLLCRPARGLTPELSSIMNSDAVTLRIDPRNLAPGVYESTATVSTWSGANAPAVRVTLRVTQ